MRRTSSNENSRPKSNLSQRLRRSASQIYRSRNRGIGNVHQEHLRSNFNFLQVIRKLRVGFREELLKDVTAFDQHWRIARLLAFGWLVKRLCVLHHQTVQSKRVVLDKVRVAHVEQQIAVLRPVVHACFAQIYSISLHDPQYRRKHLVHSLPVSNIRVQLAEYEQDVEHHLLGMGLAKVGVVGHAAVDILENLGAQSFVFAQGNPGRLSRLSQKSDLCLLCAIHRREGAAQQWAETYFIVLAQRVQGRLELIGVLDGAQKVGAEGIVYGARLGKGGGPFCAIDVFEQEECLRLRA